MSTQAPTLPLEPSIWIVYVVPAVTEKMTWLPSEQESSFEATTVRGQDEPVKIVKEVSSAESQVSTSALPDMPGVHR